MKQPLLARLGYTTVHCLSDMQQTRDLINTQFNQLLPLIQFIFGPKHSLVQNIRRGIN